MTDFTDLGHLPKAQRSTEGEPPDKESRFGRILVDELHEAGKKLDEEWAAAIGSRFRHSKGGACSRAVAYFALGVPASNPMDAPSHYITWLGHMIHEAWQAALQAKHPNAKIEVKIRGDDMGGHLDAEIETYPSADGTPFLIVDELKSVGGYKYKLAVGGFGPPQGPDYTHKIQAALNGKRRNADQIVISYLTRDAFNYAEDKGLESMARVTAEWTYDRATYMPWADKEIERVQAIFKLVDEEKLLPARKIPDPEYPLKHVIRNPIGPKGKGEWVEYDGDRLINAGAAWQCGYCDWRQLCSLTDSHRSPIVQVDEAITKLGLPARPNAGGTASEVRGDG